MTLTINLAESDQLLAQAIVVSCAKAMRNGAQGIDLDALILRLDRARKSDPAVAELITNSEDAVESALDAGLLADT